MTVTLTFDSTLSRVRITATGLAAADVATIERSTDQVTWTTVRGASAWPVTSGSLATTCDDYEFSPGVANYYRVRGVETGAITFVNQGVTSSDANAAGSSTIAPALPASLVVGDLMVLHASIRNSGTGTVNTPTGWSLMLATGNVSVFGRRYQAGDAAPTVSFTGGVANATIQAKVMAWRRADLSVGSSGSQLNASAANVAYPALTVTGDGQLVLVGGWKQDAWTSVAQLSGMTELQDAPTTLGDDASSALDYVIQTTAANIAAGSFTVTGGISAISRGWALAIPHAPYLNEQTANISPSQSTVWLKNVGYPFLNRAVEPDAATSDVSRSGRAAVFPVVGRSLPTAVTDLRLGKSLTLVLQTATGAQADEMDLILSAGGVVYLQVPNGYRLLPGGYYAVDTTGMSTRDVDPESDARWFTLQLSQVAAPDNSIVGTTSTYQATTNHFATYAATQAALPTYADRSAYIASPSDVIVG